MKMERAKNATWWAIKQNNGFYKNANGITCLYATLKDAQTAIDIIGLVPSKPIKVRVSIKPV